MVAVDTNAQATDNQTFKFIGQAQFAAPDPLRYVHGDGGTAIQANTTDATDGPEMVIVLNGLVSLQATAFVL